MKTYSTTEVTVTVPDNTSCKIWENGNKKRLYIKKTYAKCSPTDCGYIDMVTGEKFMKSNPVNEARFLSEEIEVVLN